MATEHFLCTVHHWKLKQMLNLIGIWLNVAESTVNATWK